MEPINIVEMIKELLNKPCRIETTDGSVRYGTVVAVLYRDIKYQSAVVGQPVTLLFDEVSGDGVDLHIIAKIDLDVIDEGQVVIEETGGE